MKTNKNIPDDLNYLSEMGYEQFPNAEADLKQLKKRFSDKNGIQISGTFISLSIGLFLGLTLMFTILNKPNLGTSIKESENLISEKKESIPNTIQLDTVTVNKNVIVTKTHEKYEEPNINNSNQETLVGEKLEKVNVTNIINENTEPNKLKFSENVPVIFLHDLKVANYHLYYFKGQGLVNVSFNVEAAYQNNTDKKNTITSGKPNEYYLHNAIADLMFGFKKQKYQDCFTLIETIKHYNSDDVNCAFYEGMCYYQLKNYNKALEYLNAARMHKINVFKEEADYYYALCCIYTNKIQEGKELLNEIILYGGFYANRAKEQLLTVK